MDDHIATATLSKSSQITLPAAVRKALGVGVGESIEFVQQGNEIVIKKMMSRREQIEAMLAELDRIRIEQEAKMTPEQRRFNEMTKGWTARQYREYFDSLPETKAYYKEKYGV